MTITPIYTEGDFLFYVADVYRSVVAEADPDEGTTIAAAKVESVARLRDMVDGGDITIPLDFALRHAIDRVDERDGKAADKELKQALTGQGRLDLDGGHLDTVVVLGNGRRKPLRNLREADVESMDQERYKNLRNAQNAYDDWRITYELARAAVRKYGSIGAAVAAGVATPEEVA